VRYLSAIVEVSALAMLDARQDLALGGGVALELVCHDHTRNVSQALQQLAKESLGCGRAAPALDQDVEDISVLVDRTPKIVLLVADADEHLIHVPLIAGSGPSLPEHIGEDPAKAQAPLANALVADDDPHAPPGSAQHLVGSDARRDRRSWVVSGPSPKPLVNGKIAPIPVFA
jgi:hypothetical protein